MVWQHISSIFGTKYLRIEPPRLFQGLFSPQNTTGVLLYDEESFGMLKTGFGGTWFPTLFGTPSPNFFSGKFAKKGYLPKYCSILPRLVELYGMVRLRSVRYAPYLENYGVLP